MPQISFVDIFLLPTFKRRCSTCVISRRYDACHFPCWNLSVAAHHLDVRCACAVHKETCYMSICMHCFSIMRSSVRDVPTNATKCLRVVISCFVFDYITSLKTKVSYYLLRFHMLQPPFLPHPLRCIPGV